MSGTPVVTRFAPSPTGYLHIGGARTALFNWLYARHMGGKMLLRIEDTDRQRSTDEAVTAILEGMKWLGLDWDGEPVSQFSRLDEHKKAVDALLASGNAYKCYCSREELDAMREKATAEGRPPRYDGTWRDRSEDDAPEGVAPVVRFRSPEEGETVIEDQVQGTVTFANKELDDLIILRSDGTPTYNLSVVVDDHDMGVTHIVRGVDHLTNAARQTQIYKALGWDVPVMAHIPLIHGPDGAKLSKRHGALGVEAYREMGYLPQAMRNYLARLGWSHGDDEVFSTEQMISWFELSGIGKSAARFDFAKLENLNGHYMRSLDDAVLLEEFFTSLPYLPGGKDFAAALTPESREAFRIALPGLKDRAKTLVELVSGAQFLVAQRPLTVDEKAEKLLTDEARAILGELNAEFEALGDWAMEPLESVVRDFAERKELKLGKVAQPLRAALTGTTTSPGIFDVLLVLGREESLGRIADQAKTNGS
ncbi:glutamate--tRNA ligase [Tepidamorphus sp. 3E244]|uniref:glutamate--tRNA ligase n=1 Tax=Tepidamorphus sp. 3E244 TaxID=3385498 RepID=UPI0038FCED83